MEKYSRRTVAETPKTPETKSFYELHKKEVFKLTTLANLDIAPDISLSDLVESTQPWAKGDHYDPQFPINQSFEQTQEALEVFNNLGFLELVEPEGGEYDQVLILGGEQNSNHIRIDFALNLLGSGQATLSDDGTLVCLGGDRQLKVRELGAVGQDIDKINNNPDMKNMWANQLLRDEMTASMTEEAAMRVALTARLGALNLVEKHIRLESSSTISHNVYSQHGFNIPNIATVFAPKVHRPLGDPRHTTESTVVEWLNHLNPKEGSRVLFVSNAPYTIRTARNFYTAVKNLRPDLKLDYSGAEAANDSLLSRRCYGELARLLFDDNKLSI